MDTVTSLAVVSNSLISGSKDKNLRLWCLESPTPTVTCTTHAFNDEVKALEPDNSFPLCYAGSRDGQVKICKIAADKTKFIGGIIAHSQSVNSICSLGDKSMGLFATASADTTVKFWKPESTTAQRIFG